MGYFLFFILGIVFIVLFVLIAVSKIGSSCEHEKDWRKYLQHIRNIYGDEIKKKNGMRAEYRCIKCGKTVYKDTPKWTPNTYKCSK